MYPVVWWIATAVVFFILELTTASFFFLWIGAGAVVTAILSVFIEKAPIEYATFAGSSILLVALSRPWASHFSGKSTRASNVDSLIGQKAIVTKVEKDRPAEGYVKVNGEVWKARTLDQEPLKLNEELIVVEVRGNILMVKS